MSGASAGSIAALALLSGVPLGEITSNVLRIASEVGVAFMGTFFQFCLFFVRSRSYVPVLSLDLYLFSKIQGNFRDL